MPLFRCANCGCRENTALSNYWSRAYGDAMQLLAVPPPPLCSACDPRIGHWHNQFTKESADGMLVGADGFLYYQGQFDLKQVHHTTARARLVGGKEVPL